ncbi:uncharacterized protein Z520_05428 [Fonsecaea multimorphosa CBS 102226]|uniref:OPA3-like protein n=1 Tax=Fonsecaea multimorphosa CBS 102226 TaxID=1442371 RepID=A0A0D2JZN5_9EURO|nr:uncharacterized protein Z520_05428 [Fonsecaea multimorphosa CBS 102226]KIX98967.1 hypothetical protein Z520_05428 [Fonsecaea multimorphosa CBS 102226]
MSLALKFTSLAIRTLSKPIANFIKKQAREHEGFRRTCISFAQTLHRIDMRWRIGLLQDAASLERQIAKEQAADAAKKHKHNNIPTVKTEAQTKAEEEAAARAAKDAQEPPKPRAKPKIRPLSEAKAIESGANFISEAFLFSVAAGLILLESWRSGRKATQRRDDIAERLNDLEESEKAARTALVELEREVLRLRAQENNGKPTATIRLLPKEIYQDKEDEKPAEPTGYWSRLTSLISFNKGDKKEAKEALAENEPGPAERILVQSDKALEEKHKQQKALEDAGKAATAEQKLKQDTPNWKKKSDMIHAMFSKSLRSRPEWRTLGPTLGASTSIDFQEDQAIVCDLVIPLGGFNQRATLNVLLLWSSDPVASTEERMRPFLFKAEQGSDHYVTVVIDNKGNPMHALGILSSLQSRMLDVSLVPILIALSVEGILPTIERYIQELHKNYEIKIPPVPMPETLIAHATISAPAQPLSQHEANVLTDLCHSIRDLEEATRTSSGREQLAEHLGPAVTKNLVDFWEDEWII